MRAHGALRPDAGVDALTHILAAAFQGGTPLLQASGDAAPLRDALHHAVEAVRAQLTPAGDPRARTR